MTEENKETQVENQRKSRRVSGSVIEYSYIQAESVRVTAFMKDLSVGGVCVYMHDKLPLQTELILLIHHFGNETPIETKGLVVWQRPSNYLNCFDTGIQFTEIGGDEKAKLEMFINAFCKDGKPPSDVTAAEPVKESAQETPAQAPVQSEQPAKPVEHAPVETTSKDGVYRQYYSTGEILSEVNIVNGQMEGVKKYYYRTGELLEELNWKNGKREGMRKCYYTSGTVYLEQEFKDGETILVRKYDNKGKLIEESAG